MSSTSNNAVEVDAKRLRKVLKFCHEGDPSAPFPTKELYEVSQQLVPGIFWHWNRLKAILERHEELIRKRWSKKTPTKKKELLLKAWPDMSAMHRPDYEEVLTPKPGTERMASFEIPPPKMPTDARLWPYINIEDLTGTKALLIFLNSRGRNPPHTFALSEPTFSWADLLHKLKFRERWPRVTMSFTDCDTPETFGQIKEWPNDQIAEQVERSGDGCHPGAGIHILHIQHRIYQFLVKCCELILHDIPSANLTGAGFPILPEPPSLLGSEETSSSFAKTAILAPYCPRSALNIARLEHLVSIMFEDAKDRMWALREDPSFFAGVIESVLEHRTERIPDKAGNTEPIPLPTVLRGVVIESYNSVIVWEQLDMWLKKIKEFSKKYPEGIDRKTRHPVEYYNALCLTVFFLKVAKTRLFPVLSNSLMGSPKLRSYITRERIGSLYRVTVSPSLFDNKTGYRAYQCLRGVVHSWEGISRPHTFLDIFETFSRRQPESREWVTSRTEWSLTQISIVVECLHQFKLQPWFTGAEFAIMARKEEIQRKFLSPLTGWVQMFMNDSEAIPFAKLGDPSDGKFYYPVDKPRTQRNVDAMIAAEKNLDTFWDHLERHIQDRYGRQYGRNMNRLLCEVGPLQRTRPWVEPKTKKKTVQSSTKPSVEYHPPSPAEHDNTKDITGNFNKLAIAEKTKTKTRGIAANEEPAQEEADEEVQEDPEEEHVFFVDKASITVFKALFHTPDQSAVPGKIKWETFRSALTKLGFSAEKMHGSAWQFTPTRVESLADGTRGIQFHEPHPDGDIPLFMARQFGRRLSRAYGWHGGMFQEK